MSGRWIGGIAVTVVLGLFLAFAAAFTVDQSERGFVIRFGKIARDVEPGLNFKNPFIEGKALYSLQDYVVTWKDMEAYSKDQQPATMRVTVTYNLKPDKLRDLYMRYGSATAAVERELHPKVPTFLKVVFGGFTAVTAIQDRGRLVREVTQAIEASVADTPLDVRSVQIEDIAFSDSYTNSVEAAAQAQVEVQRREQQLRQEQVQAQITVTQAKAAADAKVAAAEAEAQAIKLKGEAEATAIKARADALAQNANLVTLTAAEKWNGVLPATMLPGASVPFVQVPSPTP